MTSLKAEPAGRIRSMAEFFALAHAMELDAATRYTEIARQLRQQDEGALADVFDGLAETERGHIREVDQWAEHQGTEADSDAPWPIPDTFDAPPTDVAQSRLMTPYKALAFAVRHEERAFAFWTYVAAHAERSDIKQAAEHMALEELGHVSLLRAERRKAFHAGRREMQAVGDGPVTLAALAASERRVADLVTCHPAEKELTAALADAARAAAEKLDALSARSPDPFMTPALPADRSDDLVSICEHLAEAYLRLAEVARQEGVVDVAQQLGAAAIYRLGMLAPKEDVS